MQIRTYLYMYIYFSAMHLQLLCIHTHENNDVFYFFFLEKKDPVPGAQFQMQRGVSVVKVWVVEMLCAWMERCLCNESKNDVELACHICGIYITGSTSR